jgi:hypothetical protein
MVFSHIDLGRIARTIFADPGSGRLAASSADRAKSKRISSSATRSRNGRSAVVSDVHVNALAVEQA